MVTKGQLLERPVVIPSGPHCLDGIYLRGEGPGLLVASPLPLGGSMTNPVVNELAYAAAYAGRASLRLDYRGVGASEGEVSAELAESVRDLQEGIAFLLESTGSETLGVAGYDSGCWAALATAKADDRVDRLMLVCPTPPARAPEGTPLLQDVVRPTLIVLPSQDPQLDLAAWDELANQAMHVRLHMISADSRALRQGLLELARMIPRFLGAPPKE